MWSKMINFISKEPWIIAIVLFIVSFLCAVVVVEAMSMFYEAFFGLWCILFSIGALIVLAGCVLDKWKF